MSSKPLLVQASALAVVLGLSACAAGSGPDLSGPQGPAFLSAYSGDWVLLRLESDDLDAQMQENTRDRGGRRQRPGGFGGGGGRGGGDAPPDRGGMTGGRGGRIPGGDYGGGGGMDPELMMLVMRTTQAMALTPTEINLTLRPESVAFLFADSAQLALPLGGEETKFIQGGVDVFALAKWTKTGLEIERKVDGGGGVKDTFYVDEDGRLLLKREIEPPRGGKVEGILVYARGEG